MQRAVRNEFGHNHHGRCYAITCVEHRGFSNLYSYAKFVVYPQTYLIYLRQREGRDGPGAVLGWHYD